MPDTVAEQLVYGSLVSFFDSLLSLPSEQRDIVAWRFQGLSYKEIAARQGTSSQLAEMRHKLALRKCPILRTLFPEKMAKRRRRLSHR
jgi:DNA-directed RNA polymerase specialized sigma24 family protein